MKIEEALQSKKAELDELQKDIDSLEDQALKIKDFVKKYNDLKSRSAELKKVKRARQKEFDVVTGFFQNVNGHYLDNILPLFAGQEKREAATA